MIREGAFRRARRRRGLRRNTDGDDCPIARCYKTRTSPRSARAPALSAATPGATSPGSSWVLEESRVAAIADGGLEEEHRDFLRELNYDGRGYRCGGKACRRGRCLRTAQLAGSAIARTHHRPSRHLRRRPRGTASVEVGIGIRPEGTQPQLRVDDRQSMNSCWCRDFGPSRSEATARRRTIAPRLGAVAEQPVRWRSASAHVADGSARKPILSLRTRIGSGSTPRMASRRTHLVSPPRTLNSTRQPEGELDQAVVEERQPRLDRVRHRVAVLEAQQRGSELP